VYKKGQGFTLCYRVNPTGTPFHVRLFETTNGVNQGVQTEWDDNGTLNGSWNDCITNLAWDQVAGTHILRLEATVGGLVVNTSVSATVQ
jgi:hypothetical protein